MSLLKFKPEVRKKIKMRLKNDIFLQKAHQAKEMFLAACKVNNTEYFEKIYKAFTKEIKINNLKNQSYI